MTTITPDMSLDPILEHMGREATTLQEAELMRDVLTAHYGGADLATLTEQDWLSAQGQMQLLKMNTEGMGGDTDGRGEGAANNG